MRSLYSLVVLVCVLMGGCSSRQITETFPLEGTDTVAVRIAVDKKTGKPYVKEETVVVNTGQRIVWVGPTDFQIVFPDGSPFQADKYSTEDAVINLTVPKNKDKRSGTKTKYKYDVIVNGERLDPHIVIIEL